MRRRKRWRHRSLEALRVHVEWWGSAPLQCKGRCGCGRQTEVSGGLGRGGRDGELRTDCLVMAGAALAEAGGWGPGAFPPTSHPAALRGDSASGNLSELLCSFSARGVPRATLCVNGARWHVLRYSYDRVAMRQPFLSQISI